jgi:hypothetical protein
VSGGVRLPLSGLQLTEVELAKLVARPSWERAEVYAACGLDFLERSELEELVRRAIAAQYGRRP